MLRRSLVGLAALLAVGTAHAQVQLREVATVDLDSTANASNPEFIGSNPSAVAWNGADLFVAGFNNSGSAGTTAIVKVTGALGGTPTIGAPFGALATPALRGYSGLDVSGGTLAAAFDSGASDPNGITGYDLTGALQWAKAGRGGSGVGFDPGFLAGAGGQGVGWTTFGSGRRSLQDTATGADLFTSSTGMIINGTGTGTFWRDMEFDDATGDIWLREGNNVIQGVRSGDNSLSATNLVVDEPEADFVAGQNIAFCAAPGGTFVIYNDREVTSGTQSFFDVVKVIQTDGTALVADFGSFDPAVGSGYYDFSFDAATGTLALLDFVNRNVHIFEVAVVNHFPYGAGCANSAGDTLHLFLTGNVASGSSLAISIEGGEANGTAFLALGAAQGSAPLGTGCNLLVSPLIGLVGPLPLSASGDFQYSAVLPTLGPGTATLQALGSDAGSFIGFHVSNGVQVDI